MVQQIEEEKQKENVVEEAAQQALVDSRTPVEQTLHFLAELEALMQDYQPVLPAITDNTDLLKCVTDYQVSSNKDLKARSKLLNKQRQNSQRERQSL